MYIKKSYNRDGSLLRYGRRMPRGISGLGDACSDYGATTNADGTCHTVIAGPGSDKPIETSTTGSGGGDSGFDSFMKGVSSIFAPAQQPVVMAPQSSGISTTTLVIGGIALVGLAMIMMKSRS